MTAEFPLAYALTQRFTLGEPRNVALFGGTHSEPFALFLRSDAGDDPTNHLWTVDLTSGAETKLVDARDLLDHDNAELPPAERERRERLREGGAGITSYATDASGRIVAFALSGQLFCIDLDDESPTVRRVDVAGPVFDPRPSPDGALIGFAREATFVVADLDGTVRLELAPGGDDISWGTADFVAAEEMGRTRGFWWSPDSTTVAVCRNDVSAVEQWWIANPALPAQPPLPHRYPQAGTPNPDVQLYTLSLDGSDDAELRSIEWDRSAFPYLAAVSWTRHGFTTTVQTRDQTRVSFLSVEPSRGTTTEIGTDHNERWVDLVPGSGVRSALGLVTCAERDGSRRLLVDGAPVSPADVQIERVLAVDDDGVLAAGNRLDASTERHVYLWDAREFRQVTTEVGVHTAAGSSTSYAVRSASLERPGGRWTMPGGHVLASTAWTPPVLPEPIFLRTGPMHCATAVLLPTGYEADRDGALPVLLDPYGGPHGARVLASYNAWCASQWFADQGFAVIVTDGRGTPGRGTEFERAVWGDLASGVLDDQVASLRDVAAAIGGLDLRRVAIRGWSFGGYLSALAVLRRPDVFHAAVAGAPVTDWRLYDTHYTEPYLGNPNDHPDRYDTNSLIDEAPNLERPLLLIHGLSDDNVVVAHTLQMSAALLSAGRDHEVLPLSGVTHMTPQAEVAQNLLIHQLRFIQRSLASPPATPSADGVDSEPYTPARNHGVERRLS